MPWWWKARDSPPNRISEDFGGVTSARFIEGGVADDVALGKRVALELTGRDARTLVEHLAVIDPDVPFHCMCLGDWAIELYAANERLVTVGLHHAQSIRVQGWGSDALLRDGEGLVRFLASQGLEAPLRELEEDRAVARNRADARANWLAVAPAVLRDMLPRLEGDAGGRLLASDDPDVVDALRRMRAEAGDPTTILLAWYGSGVGSFTGFPSYENVPGALLTAIGAQQVVKVAERSDDRAVLFGAVRHLTRWNAPSRERRLVSDQLAAQLRRATAAWGDSDANARLEAFLAPLLPAEGPVAGRAEAAREFSFVIAIDHHRVGSSVAAIDGDELVLFNTGERWLVATGLGSAGAVTAVGMKIYVARIKTSDIVMVDLEDATPSGAPQVPVTVTTEVREVRSIAATAERIAWIENWDHVFPPRYVVAELGRTSPWAALADRAWDLALPGPMPLWGIPRHSPVDEAESSTTEVVRAVEGGAPTVVATIRADMSHGCPRLVADRRRCVCCTGRDVLVFEATANETLLGVPRKMGLDRHLQCIALDADVLWAIALSDERDRGELLRIDLNAGLVQSRLVYPRARYHQERLSIASGHVAWNVGSDAYCVPK